MYIVEFYASPNGRQVVRDIYYSFPEKQRSKISNAIHILKEFGISREIPHLRKLSGTKLWEYRILGKDNIRIICVTVINNKIVVLNIFSKKKQKTPVKELNVSLERYKILLDR